MTLFRFLRILGRDVKQNPVKLVNGRIRFTPKGEYDENNCLCPLTAVCLSYSGKCLGISDYGWAGDILSLEPEVALAIANAADNRKDSPRFNPKLRKVMLKVLGL